MKHLYILPPSLENIDATASRLFKNGQYERALSAFESLALEGNSKCLLFAGWMYLKGKGTIKNFAKAKQHFLSAINLRNHGGYYYLGLLDHMCGDFDGAYKNYAMHIENGGESAFYEIGLLYMHGRGINKDAEIAYKYFLEAEKRGNVFAMKARAYFLLNEYKWVGYRYRIKGFMLLMKSYVVALWYGLKEPFRYDGI